MPPGKMPQIKKKKLLFMLYLARIWLTKYNFKSSGLKILTEQKEIQWNKQPKETDL